VSVWVLPSNSATIHKLVTNCLGCGKIVCEAETQYSGDQCPFCGHGLYDAPKPRIGGHDLYKMNEDSLEADRRKDTLLEFDRNSTARTRVIDVATDYDSQLYDKWQSTEQKAEVMAKLAERERIEEESRSRRVITLDLENKRIVVEKPVKVEVKKEEIQKEHVAGVFRNPNLKKQQLVFMADGVKVPVKKIAPLSESVAFNRLQDDDRD
jgi:DNA-directed RNA polymerase subunit RPC12/RpoP